MIRGISKTIREAKEEIKESFKEAMVTSPVTEALEIYHEAELEMEEMLNDDEDKTPRITSKDVFTKISQ